MTRARTAAWATLVGLLVVCPACATSGEAVPPAKPDAARAEPRLSPEEQAARDLLERYKAEAKVRQEERLQLAAQHLKTGKAHLEMGAWKLAHEHFQKAVALDPSSEEAQQSLKRAAGLLGLKQSGAGLIEDYIGQEKVRVAARRTELDAVLARAKAAYDKGQLVEALELFVRVKASAQYLAPYLDTAQALGEAETMIEKCKAGMDAERRKAQQDLERRAREEAERRRGNDQSLLRERQRALLDQARSLFAERRFEQARKACDEVLRCEPGNAQASALREQAADAARTEAIAHALSSRDAEARRCLDELTACLTVQNEILSISRERLEELRRRKGEPMFDAHLKAPEPWEGRIREALERRVTFDFVETSVPDVISFLANVADVNMVLDGEAVQGGVPPISLRVENMTLGAALNWICKLIGFRFSLRDEAIFLSKPERIPSATVMRIYDITDLTMEIKNFKGRQRALATDSGIGPAGEGSNLRDFFRDDEEEREKPMSGSQMIEFLRHVVGPDGWGTEDGMDRVRQVVGLPAEERPGKGQELLDLVSIVVGGRTFLGVKSRE